MKKLIVICGFCLLSIPAGWGVLQLKYMEQRTVNDNRLAEIHDYTEVKFPELLKETKHLDALTLESID